MNRVVFSCPHPLGQGGPSRPLTRMHEAFASAWQQAYRVLEPAEFPQLTELNRLGDAIGPVFDDLAADALLEDAAGVQGFLGGCGASLQQLGVVHGRTNAPAGIVAFSSHWAHAQNVLKEEYRHFGVQPSPIHPYVAWRAEREQEEADFLIVPSEFCADTYPAEVRAKVRVAEFGVDLPAPPPGAGPGWMPARDWGAPRLRVLMPATNPIRKGLRSVLQAMEQLAPGRFQFTITGGWQGGTPRMADGNILMTTGWVPDDKMRALMADHHVLLLPSLEEGQALASLEGAAAGMALVLTPNVGLPIADHCEGIIVAPRSPAAIVAALTELEKDRDAGARMGRAAWEFARQRPWSRFEQRVVEILRKEGIA